jgi:hypothetical protein
MDRPSFSESAYAFLTNIYIRKLVIMSWRMELSVSLDNLALWLFKKISQFSDNVVWPGGWIGSKTHPHL